jgi:hypothetical protein
MMVISKGGYGPCVLRWAWFGRVLGHEAYSSFRWGLGVASGDTYTTL